MNFDCDPCRSVAYNEYHISLLKCVERSAYILLQSATVCVNLWCPPQTCIKHLSFRVAQLEEDRTYNVWPCASPFVSGNRPKKGILGSLSLLLFPNAGIIWMHPQDNEVHTAHAQCSGFNGSLAKSYKPVNQNEPFPFKLIISGICLCVYVYAYPYAYISTEC